MTVADITVIKNKLNNIWTEVINNQYQLYTLTTVVIIFAVFTIAALIFVIIQNVLLNQKLKKLIAVSDGNAPSQLTFNDLLDEQQPQKEFYRKKSHISKREKYTKWESTPLFFHKFLLFFSFPLSTLQSLVYIISNGQSLSNSSVSSISDVYNVTKTSAQDILDQLRFIQFADVITFAIWFILYILFVVGSIKRKPFGWISVNAMFICDIISTLLIVTLTEILCYTHPIVQETVDISTSPLWGNVIASVVYAAFVFIYYKKRKPLFYPDLARTITVECEYE